MEISFYIKQYEKEKWRVRELKRQMKSMLFHRLALSTDKEGVLKLANEGHDIQQTEDPQGLYQCLINTEFTAGFKCCNLFYNLME